MASSSRSPPDKLFIATESVAVIEGFAELRDVLRTNDDKKIVKHLVKVRKSLDQEDAEDKERILKRMKSESSEESPVLDEGLPYPVEDSESSPPLAVCDHSQEPIKTNSNYVWVRISEDGRIPIKLANWKMGRALVDTGASGLVANSTAKKDLNLQEMNSNKIFEYEMGNGDLVKSGGTALASFWIEDCLYQEECDIMKCDSKDVLVLGREFLRKYKYNIINKSVTEDWLKLERPVAGPVPKMDIFNQP